MEKRYVLASDIRYRRESFGGLIYSNRSKTTKFFNHMAAFAIEEFVNPSTFSSVDLKMRHLLQVSKSQATFLASLETQGIIKAVADGTKCIGKVFFTNVTDFFDDRLYAPLGVEIELTLKCFRHCAYCAYNSSPDVVTDGQLNRRDYKSLLSQFDKIGIFYIRFTGGDPLARSDCLDLLDDVSEFPFGITVASDLTVLRKEHVDHLKSIPNLIAVQTTLDGSTPQLANKLRGDGNFQRVIQGIPELRKNGVPVIVGTVLTKLNVNNIYDIAKLLSNWNVTYCVSPLYDAGRGRMLSDLIPDDNDLNFAYEQFAAAVNEGLVQPADPAWEAIALGVPSNLRRALWHDQPWLIRSPDRLIRVDPFGRCYTSIHLKEVFGEEIYVGKLPDSDLLALWNSSPLLNRLRISRELNRYYGDVLDIRKIKISTHGGAK